MAILTIRRPHGDAMLTVTVELPGDHFHADAAEAAIEAIQRRVPNLDRECAAAHPGTCGAGA